MLTLNKTELQWLAKGTAHPKKMIPPLEHVFFEPTAGHIFATNGEQGRLLITNPGFSYAPFSVRARDVANAAKVLVRDEEIDAVSLPRSDQAPPPYTHVMPQVPTYGPASIAPGYMLYLAEMGKLAGKLQGVTIHAREGLDGPSYLVAQNSGRFALYVQIIMPVRCEVLPVPLVA